MNKFDDNTQFSIDVNQIKEAAKRDKIKKDLDFVYQALCEKGYNPTAQIIGYILSEDPTYITAHNNARLVMSKLDRYEILEELLKTYYNK